MTAWGNSKKTFRQIVEEKNAWRRELRNESIALNRRIAEDRDNFDYGLLKKISEQAGVDFDAIEKETTLWQNAQSQKDKADLKTLEEKIKKRVAEKRNPLNGWRLFMPKRPKAIISRLFTILHCE